MVKTAKGRNVKVILYKMSSYSVVTGADDKTFTVLQIPAELTDVKYSRAYVDTQEVAIASATGTVVTLVSDAPAGSLVEIFTPTSTKMVFAGQQDLRGNVKAKTQDLQELGSPVVTKDVVETSGDMTLSFLVEPNKSLAEALNEFSEDEQILLAIARYTFGANVSYRIYKEATLGDHGDTTTAGGMTTQNITVFWKTPLEIIA